MLKSFDKKPGSLIGSEVPTTKPFLRPEDDQGPGVFLCATQKEKLCRKKAK